MISRRICIDEMDAGELKLSEKNAGELKLSEIECRSAKT